MEGMRTCDWLWRGSSVNAAFCTSRSAPELCLGQWRDACGLNMGMTGWPSEQQVQSGQVLKANNNMHMCVCVCVCVLQTLHEQMAASVHEISNLIDPVAVAAHSEASQLGHKVTHRTTPTQLTCNMTVDKLLVHVKGNNSLACSSLTCSFYFRMSVLNVSLRTGLSDGQLLWAPDHGSHWHSVQDPQQPTADGCLRPDQNPDRVRLADALHCQGGWRKPQGNEAGVFPKAPSGDADRPRDTVLSFCTFCNQVLGSSVIS